MGGSESRGGARKRGITIGNCGGYYTQQCRLVRARGCCERFEVKMLEADVGRGRSSNNNSNNNKQRFFLSEDQAVQLALIEIGRLMKRGRAAAKEDGDVGSLLLGRVRTGELSLTASLVPALEEGYRPHRDSFATCRSTQQACAARAA